MAKKKKKSNGNGGAKPISDRQFLREKAKTLPIHECYVTDGWETTGEAMVVVTRERPSGNLCVAAFLCDTWCMGVKDVFGNVNMTKEDFKEEILDRNRSLRDCNYVYAHNLIYGAEAFAADADIESAPEFELWSNVLEEDTDDVPLVEFEFGDHGKYHLVALPGSREALQASGLKTRLGDDFICEIVDYRPKSIDDYLDDEEFEYDDDDFDDDDRADDETLSPMSLLKTLSEGMAEVSAEDKRHPDEPYTYQHPDYPDRLDIKHKFIADEFRKPTNSDALPVKVIDRILALPKDEVARDVCNIVMYRIGSTWKAIDEDSLEWMNDNTLMHAMAMLAQLGDPSGVYAVLEVLRQDQAFLEYHFGDFASMILPQALYVTGKNRPELLEEFLKHPGYDGYAKGYVSDALSFIAMEEPERRDEVIGIYGRYLDFMQENMPAVNGCSGMVAGFMMSNLMDLGAKELLPKIKKLYDSGYVNLNICGDYEEVKSGIGSGDTVLDKFDFTDIKDFYNRM